MKKVTNEQQLDAEQNLHCKRLILTMIRNYGAMAFEV